MRKILKWIGIILGGFLVAILILSGVSLVLANARFNQTYPVQVENLAIPSDAGSVERGKHIAATVCTGCHTQDLSGNVVMDSPGFASLYSTNLTHGLGGVGSEYQDADWIRAIRHGVDPEGKSLLIMPSEYFYNFSDEDLGALIAYIKSLPPIDHQVPDPSFALPARVLFGLGLLNIDVARQAPQSGARPISPPPGVSVEYGAYLVETRICQSCHGKNLAGGPNPDPRGPAVPNITPGGEPGQWTQAQFIQTIRTGKKPDGHDLNTSMPWQTYQNLTDVELQAIWLYLQSVPAVPSTPTARY